MFYLTIGQIGLVYAYAFSVDLLESILLLTGVLALDFMFFLALRNMEEFQSRSILVVLCVLVSSMFRLILFPDYEEIASFLSGELTWWVTVLLPGLAIAAAASKVRWLRKILDGIAERAIVFLYIYLPLSFISLPVVLIRNLS
jgi:hypothetical protein